MGVRTWFCMCLLAHCVPLTSCYSRKLLYSSFTSIMEFDFDTRNVTLLVELDRGLLFAMDYDYKNKFMYFPRYLDDDIVRFAYPSKNITLQTVIQSLSYPSGIAVDSTNDHIYWIDIGTHGLSRCNLDGSNVMLVSTYNYPYVVRIDVTNRWLYVVENSMGIWKSQFNLPAKQKILNFTSTSAYCMDIDTEENRLYWINYEGDIKSAKDDGSDIKTIFSTLDQRIFRAIRVIGTNIYYAHNNQLLMVSKTPGSTPTVLYFDSGDIHSMFVFNEADSTNLCGQNVDHLNTTWRLTEPNTLVVQPCTGEYTGNASRYCSSDGKWVEPSYIHCISKSIQQLKEQTSKLLSGESDYNLTIILKDLENITNDNDELRSGDLLTSSAVLNDIAKYVTDYSDKLEVDQLEIFGSLCDNLLDERNHRQWKELNNEGSGGITPLVNAVTEYNNAFNEVIDSNYSLVVAKKNVVMQVGKTSVDEITVPDRQKTSNSWIADSATEIKLKKIICSGFTGYSSTFYRNISSFFPEYLILNGAIKPFNGSFDVNSIVADFTIHGTPCSNYSLLIKFEHLLGKYTRPFCGHWNFSTPNTVNGAWSSYGSQVVGDTDSYTICEYNHTTNFAILMSPGKTPSSHHDPLSYISAIGCGVSIFFLVITILIHFVLWRYLGNDRTKTLMNLCVALILSYILFLAGITRTENKIVCTAIAVALHYMFLTDFALMLAEGIQIVRMVVIVFPTKSIVHKLIPACWIVPACIVAISAGVTKLKGYGNEQFCWLTLESYLIWAFIGPALLVILINFIIIIITVYKMLTSRGLAAKTLKVKSKIGLKSICVILPLFGVTWVLGAFSVNDDLVIFQYLFAIFNSLQGLFICLFHCFLNKQVRQAYQQYQRRRHANRMDSKHSTDFSNLDRPKSRLSIKDNIRAQEK